MALRTEAGMAYGMADRLPLVTLRELPDLGHVFFGPSGTTLCVQCGQRLGTFPPERGHVYI